MGNEEPSKWTKFWTGADDEHEAPPDEKVEASPADPSPGTAGGSAAEPEAVTEPVRTRIVPETTKRPMDATETAAVIVLIFFPYVGALMGAGLIARGSYYGWHIAAGSAVSLFAWAFVVGLIISI